MCTTGPGMAISLAKAKKKTLGPNSIFRDITIGGYAQVHLGNSYSVVEQRDNGELFSG